MAKTKHNYANPIPMTHHSMYRTPVQRAHDMSIAADLYLRGKTIYQIAEIIVAEIRPYKYTFRMAYADVKKAERIWISKAVGNFDEFRGKELAEIDALEKAYWEAYESSKRDGIATAVTKTQADVRIPPIIVTQVTKAARDGSVGFLMGIERCIDKRCKILGLYSPEKFQVGDWRKEAEKQGVDVSSIFNQLVGKYVTALESSTKSSKSSVGDEDGSGSVERSE